MNQNSSIYISGHSGMVGSSLYRLLVSRNYKNLIVKNHNELDLTKQNDTYQFFETHRPEYVFMAAAKVGGIQYNNSHAADFIRDNILIQTNTIDAAHKYGVKKICFLGTACIYPKFAPVPIQEQSLLSGYLEQTNEAYAIAKIAGYIMCKKYFSQYGLQTISVMPTNLYGINDNFNLQQCHVIPSMIRKFIEAKESRTNKVTLYGDGSATREFLHVDDLSEAILFLMNTYNNPEIINIGTGQEISIKMLAIMIANIAGYNGDIIWDQTMPNGTPRRVLDVSKIHQLGWKPKKQLQEGLIETIEWFMANRNKITA